jgi:hypothetical protein
VHPTCGSLRDLQAFFWLRVFSTSQTLSTPTHTRVTQTVGRLVIEIPQSENTMNSDNPQTKNSVAVDGNMEDSNIIIGNNNNITKATQKHSPLCNYSGCEFESGNKCNSCGKVFCLKHIAYFAQPWLKHWLCAECVRKKVDSQKQIANTSIVIGGVGLFLSILGISTHDYAFAICLGSTLAGGGFGTGIGFGIRYFSTQRALSELFPEEEIIHSKKDSLVNVSSLGEIQITKAEFTELTYRQKFTVTEYGYLLSPEDAETVGKMLGGIVREKDIPPFCQANGKKVLSYEQ